jgi:hypothetical protein
MADTTGYGAGLAPWCARGAWPAVVRDQAAKPRQAIVRAFSTDGMLMDGDLDIKSGERVHVEVELDKARPAVVTAEVRRALGATFLRFEPDGTRQRERLLEAVGCPPAGARATG